MVAAAAQINCMACFRPLHGHHLRIAHLASSSAPKPLPVRRPAIERLTYSPPHRRTTCMALPVVPIFTIVYGLGAARFWGGFNKTTFDNTKKAQLTALWPFLFVASESFRRDFRRAISGD